MSYDHELDSLLLYDPNRSRATTNVWVARPTPDEQQRLGKLFMIVSIDTHQRINHDIIGIIQDEVRTQFYQGQGLSPERQLEHAVHHTNQRLHDLIADGVNQWVSQCHILLGLVHGHQVTLFPVRSVHAFRLHQSRLVDILGEPNTAPPNPLRVFSESLNGTLEPNDCLLVCLPSLLDYFSLEKLRRTMLDYPPHEAVRQLEQQLMGVDPSVSFGAMIFRFIPETELAVPSVTIAGIPDVAPAPTPYIAAPRHMGVDGAPQRSMETLIEKEKNTAQLLAPSAWPAIRQSVSGVGEFVQRFFRTLILRKPPRRHVPYVPETTPAPRQSLSTTVSRPSINLQPVLTAMSRTIQSLAASIRVLFHRRRAITEPVTTMMRPSRRWRVSFRWWYRLTARQRQLVVIALILLVILSTVMFRNGGTQSKKVATNTTSSVTDIQTNLDRAQSALVYGGESTARISLTTAQDEITALPTKTKTEKQQKDAFTGRLNDLLAQVMHQTKVTQTQSIAQATSGVQPKQLYLVGSSVVSVDAATSHLMITNLITHQTTTKAVTVDVGTLLTGTPISNSTIVFLTNRQSFAEYDVTKDSWKPLTATLATSTIIPSLSWFQNRLYALDTGSNAILKFTRSPATYGTGVNWLKAPTDLHTARQVVVDGSIYVLLPNGQVEVYFGGKITSFTLDTITPALTDATRIWTDANSKYLYLLEPKNKRIVAYDKNGKFLRQYSADSWTDLRDLVVNEKDKLVYILNGQQTTSFALTDIAL